MFCVYTILFTFQLILPMQWPMSMHSNDNGSSNRQKIKRMEIIKMMKSECKAKSISKRRRLIKIKGKQNLIQYVNMY